MEASDTVNGATRTLEGDSDRIDLVFSDVVLPDGTGLDVAERAAALRPGIRTLLTSGYAGARSRVDVIRDRGAEASTDLPIEVDELGPELGG